MSYISYKKPVSLSSYNTDNSDKPSQGVALLLNFFLGLFGVDKFYVGRYDIGILQLILTFSIIGLLVNIPLVALCTISLVIAILFEGLPFLYPGVDWAPITKTDKAIAWIVVILMFLSILTAPYRKKLNERYEVCSACGYEQCRCRGRSGCSSCSRGMVGPYD
jgi:TM2 domain-containing membrane protein YozV